MWTDSGCNCALLFVVQLCAVWFHLLQSFPIKVDFFKNSTPLTPDAFENHNIWFLSLSFLPSHWRWSWVMPWGTRKGCQWQEVLEKMEVLRLQNFQKQCMLSLTWVLAWEWMSVCDWALVVDKNLLSALHNGFLVCLLSKWWEASSILKTFLSAKNS